LEAFATDVWSSSSGEVKQAITKQWRENRVATEKGSGKSHPNSFTADTGSTPSPMKLPFQWDERRRLQLRAELDALYGELYRLSKPDLTHVLNSFETTRRKEKDRYGEFASKKLILNAYESFATSIHR
jgi:hypothetical protein